MQEADQLQVKLRRVVLRVFHHKYGCIFVKPVDVENHPDYVTIIQRPICLDEILAKANSRSYSKPEDLVEDMSLMFSNALKYNTGDSSNIFRKQTCDLEAYFKCIFNVTFGSQEPVVQAPVSEASTNKKRGRPDKKRRVTRQEIIDGGIDIATLLSTASKMCKNECETIRSLKTELDSAKKRCQEAVSKSEELQTLNDKLMKELFQWRLLGDTPPAYVVLE